MRCGHPAIIRIWTYLFFWVDRLLMVNFWMTLGAWHRQYINANIHILPCDVHFSQVRRWYLDFGHLLIFRDSCRTFISEQVNNPTSPLTILKPQNRGSTKFMQFGKDVQRMLKLQKCERARREAADFCFEHSKLVWIETVALILRLIGNIILTDLTNEMLSDIVMCPYRSSNPKGRTLALRTVT